MMLNCIGTLDFMIIILHCYLINTKCYFPLMLWVHKYCSLKFIQYLDQLYFHNSFLHHILLILINYCLHIFNYSLLLFDCNHNLWGIAYMCKYIKYYHLKSHCNIILSWKLNKMSCLLCQHKYWILMELLLFLNNLKQCHNRN